MVAKIGLDEAKLYGSNRLVTKVGNRNKAVLLEISVDNTNIKDAVEFACGNNSVAALVYEGTEQHMMMVSELDTKGVHICKVEQVASDVSESDILKLLNVLPKWASLVVEVPEDYKNMEFICNMCAKYPQVRFIGGYLFNFSECRLGICGDDVLDKLGVKSSGSMIRTGDCCGLPVVCAEDIEISVATSKDKISSGSGEKSAPKKKTVMFSSMFNGASSFGSVGAL